MNKNLITVVFSYVLMQKILSSYITLWFTTAQSFEAGNWELSHISSTSPQYMTVTLKRTLIFSKYHDTQTAAIAAQGKF